MINRKPIGAVILALGVLLLVGIVLLVNNSNRPPLPALEDIGSIKIKKFYDTTQRKEGDAFEVSEDCWSEILAALSPYEKDQNPLAWKCLADMDISTKKGNVYQLWLFDLGNDPIGAFALVHGTENRTYYRGGNSIQLKEVIKNACDRSKVKYQ
jgi:hypothetical protein